MGRKSIIFATLCLFAACQNDPTESAQYKQLMEDKEMLEQRNIDKDESMNMLFDSFNRISDNISEIRSRQIGLSEAPQGLESGEVMEDRIMEDLKMIDDLLEQNKQLISELKKSARKDDLEIKALTRTIENLEALVMEKDMEITRLKEQLESTNNSMATLMEMYKEKSQLVESQEVEMSKGYYAIGTSKELKDNGVVVKTGGVAGVGGAKTLNMDGLNKGYFTEVDITSTSSIPLMAKKAKVITSHPQGSYSIADDSSELVIKDPERFWSVSKYLVVEVN